MKSDVVSYARFSRGKMVMYTSGVSTSNANVLEATTQCASPDRLQGF